MATGDAYLTRRLRPFATTIFATMSELATETGAVNLGQGFPDTDGPEELREVAVAAIREGRNQYPPSAGIPELRQAVAAHQHAWYGLEFDADTEVLVTVGATEAIAATLLALCEPGDEVVMFEPTYDSYAACAAMAGAVPRLVRLHPPDWTFRAEELAAAFGPRTKLVLLNSPHNPTGKVFSSDELDQVAALCRAHDILAVTDEVYEHLVFEGAHVPLATLPGMAERTVTHLLGREDLLLHGLEGGMGVCRRAVGRRGAGGQAIPHLHQPGSLPTRGGPGAALSSPKPSMPSPASWPPSGTSSATGWPAWATRSTARRRPTSPPPTSHRWHRG